MPVYVNEGRTAGLERWSQIHQEVGNVNEGRRRVCFRQSIKIRGEEG